jgi:hypothetical protein
VCGVACLVLEYSVAPPAVAKPPAGADDLVGKDEAYEVLLGAIK